jgi:5'(3')-deoxyribonucleotidase
VNRTRAVGVDLDGVLANQVVGVLPRVEAEYGIALTYEEIVHWRLPIEGRDATTDIATEIVAAQTDREYVLSMPVHAGARDMLEELRRKFRVVVLTARSGMALDWSVEWLRRNDLPFDELAGSAESEKSLHGSDALVDDYLGNIEEFLKNTSGPAVLVDQPWNRGERDTLAEYVTSGRLAVVNELVDVPGALVSLERGAGRL